MPFPFSTESFATRLSPQGETRRFFLPGLLRLLLAAFFLSAPFSSVHAQTKATEYALKAANLRYLAHNIAFPPAAFEHGRAPLVIGIVGRNPFGNALEQACANEAVNGHPIEIRYLGRSGNPVGCHIVFVCDSEARRANRVIAAAVGHHMLVVGEFADFCAAGGHLNYLIVDGSMRLEFNSEAARKSGLSIPAKIQRVGTSVRTR